MAGLWHRIIHRIFGCGSICVGHWWDFDYGINAFRLECKRCGKRSVYRGSNDDGMNFDIEGFAG